MREKIVAIAQKINQQSNTPRELANCLMELSAEFAYVAGQIEEVTVKKAETWMKLRELSTSDTQANNKLSRTPEGIIENSLKLQLKVIEKLMSSIKSNLRIKELEAQNII